MRMEINGIILCTENSRNIHVRYFFVKDRVDKGDVKIEYFHILLMIEDYITNDLMEERFREFRRIIMGHKPISEMEPKYLQPIKENVEKSS